MTKRQIFRAFVRREWIIGGNIWTVKYGGTKALQGALGLCDPSTQTISIHFGQTLLSEIATFVHEFKHALAYEYGQNCPSLHRLLNHRFIRRVEKKYAEIIHDTFLE